MSNNQYTYRETYKREDDRDAGHSGSGWKSWLGLDDKNKDEYHRTVTVNRDSDNRDSHGWRSWFGGDDNKNRDNDYHYSRTTTYRNEDAPSYGRGYTSDNYNRSSDYNRGNTGYTTSTYVRDSDRDTGYNRYNRDTDTRDTRSYTTGSYDTGRTGGYTGGYSSSDNYRGVSGGYTGGYSSSDNYNRGVGVTGGSYGNRGGYGYQTSSEYNRGYGNNDRDINNRETTYVRSYNDRSDNYSRDHPSTYHESRYVSDNRGGYGGNTYGDRDRVAGSYTYNTRSNY